MSDMEIQLCAEEALTATLNILQSDDETGLIQLTNLLRQYPLDPRLHFLQGSVLAGMQRYEEGRGAMARAVEIAPSFGLARFQLGFLELTSGLADAAKATWEPFGELAENAPFRILSIGLNCLARDEFAECDSLLRKGMQANTEHPLINNDMQLILDEIRDKMPAEQGDDEVGLQPASVTGMLLQQFELKDSLNKTRH
jgi:Flp pilus assembly protein TadD